MTTLFCFPFAGGTGATYRSWQENLPEKTRVTALEMPGRGTRFSEPLLSTMEAVVDDFISIILRQDVSDRTIFFGHSMGALVAYEIARKLQLMGDLRVDALMISGGRSPLNRVPRRDLHKLTDNELARELRRIGGTPEAILQDRELLGFFLPKIRADFKILETFNPNLEGTLDIPLFVCRGERDALISRAQMSAWAPLTTNQVYYEEFSGGHFYLASQPKQLLEWVSNCIESINAGIDMR